MSSKGGNLMNPFIQQVVMSVVRHLLTMGAMYLVTEGLLTEADALQYVGAASLAIVGFGAAIYQKFTAQRKLLTAAASPGQLTEKAIEAKVAAGDAPSVMTSKTEVPSMP